MCTLFPREGRRGGCNAENWGVCVLVCGARMPSGGLRMVFLSCLLTLSSSLPPGTRSCLLPDAQGAGCPPRESLPRRSASR